MITSVSCVLKGERGTAQASNPTASLTSPGRGGVIGLRRQTWPSTPPPSIIVIGVKAIPSGSDAEIAQVSPAFQGPEVGAAAAVSRSLGDSEASNDRDLCMYVSVMV